MSLEGHLKLRLQSLKTYINHKYFLYRPFVHYFHLKRPVVHQFIDFLSFFHFLVDYITLSDKNERAFKIGNHFPCDKDNKIGEGGGRAATG